MASSTVTCSALPAMVQSSWASSVSEAFSPSSSLESSSSPLLFRLRLASLYHVENWFRYSTSISDPVSQRRRPGGGWVRPQFSIWPAGPEYAELLATPLLELGVVWPWHAEPWEYPRFLQIRLGSESCDQISASPNRPKRAKSRDETAGSLFIRVYTLVEFSQTKRCFFPFLKQNIQRQMIHQHHYHLHNTIHISLKTR